MSARYSPWILGISASHNGSVCQLHGDEIVVAVQEERLSRFKRQRIYASDSSLAAAYCLSYAGLEPSELNMVVVCIQGRASTAIQDIRLNQFLNIAPNHVPTTAASSKTGSFSRTRETNRPRINADSNQPFV